MLLAMKTETWKHIGTIARSLAARLVAAREEISTLRRVGTGAVTGSGIRTGKRPTVDADRDAQGEDQRSGFGNKRPPITQRQLVRTHMGVRGRSPAGCGSAGLMLSVWDSVH